VLDLSLSRILLWLPAVVVAITFHEYAHGKMADFLGDPTPRYQGRLTLNPIVHIDALGFLLLLVAGFGWAKPVQVNPWNLRYGPRQGMMLVALAGPLMNLVVAFTSAFILTLALPDLVILNSQNILVDILRALVVVNVYLAVFNLIPVPPLDGAKILAGLLKSSGPIYQLEAYGPVILLILVATGLIGKILIPVSEFVIYLLNLVAHIFALPFRGFF
jgi:Zn-dependent protease